MNYFEFQSVNFCPDCGQARGVCNCGYDLEAKYQQFIHTRPLSWWRNYMHEAYNTYAKITRRSLSKKDKRSLWKWLKYNIRVNNGLGSASGLAQVMYAIGDVRE